MTIIYNVISAVILCITYFYQDDSKYILYLFILGIFSIGFQMCLFLFDYNRNEEEEFINYNYDVNQEPVDIVYAEPNIKDGELSISYEEYY